MTSQSPKSAKYSSQEIKCSTVHLSEEAVIEAQYLHG